MSHKRPEGAEALIAPMYLLAFLLVATPMMDFVTSIIPLRFGDIEWRFASVGLLSGFLLTPLLGIALAMGLAHLGGHLRFQRLMAIINIVLAVLWVALQVFFVLDIFQLRAAVQAEAADAFRSAALKAVIKHVSFFLTLGYLGWRGIKVSRWRRPADARRPQAAVVVGA